MKGRNEIDVNNVVLFGHNKTGACTKLCARSIQFIYTRYLCNLKNREGCFPDVISAIHNRIVQPDLVSFY